MLFLLFFRFSSVLASLQEKKPQISAFHFPSALTSGQRVIVTCSVLEGEPPIRLFWLKDGDKVSSLPDVEEISVQDLGSSLVFRRLQRSHSGLYSCVALNARGNASFSAKMQVRVAPTWTLEPGDRAAVDGDSVRFDCQSDGFPLPVIRWKLKTDKEKDFRALSSNYRMQSLENGSLLLNDVTKDDSGLYTCEAGNGVGGDISRVVKLTVHSGAHFKRHFQSVRQRKADPLLLSCEAFGETPLTIKWTRDSTDVTLNPRFSVSERETKESLVSSLSLARAQRSDSGLFTCLAANAFGQSESVVEVVVEETPDSPKSLQLVSKSSRSATFKWDEPFDGNLALIKYQIEWQSRVVDTKETHVTLNDLEPLSEVKVRVRALNALGASVATEMTFETEEEVPSSAPTDVRVTALSSRSLKVTWRSSESHVKGYYIGYKAWESRNALTFNTVEFADKELTFVLKGLQKNTKYLVSVQSFNNRGAGPQSEDAFGQTFAFDAPSAPILSLLNSSATAVNLLWTVSPENPISGFRLFWRAIPDSWQESARPVDALSRSLVVNDVECGKHFQFYLVAFNDLGSSPASAMVSRDLSESPVGAAPPLGVLLTINATKVDIHLNSWKSNECSVHYFRVQNKALNSKLWTLVSDRVQREATLAVHGLQPGVWYCLLVSAHHNQQLFTEKEYVFATLTEDGGTVSPLTALNDRRLSRYFIVLIPISCAVSVLLVIGFVVVYICVRRREETPNKRNSLSMTEIKKEDRSLPVSYASSHLVEENTYDLPQKMRDNEYQSVCHECHHNCY